MLLPYLDLLMRYMPLKLLYNIPVRSKGGKKIVTSGSDSSTKRPKSSRPGFKAPKRQGRCFHPDIQQRLQFHSIRLIPHHKLNQDPLLVEFSDSSSPEAELQLLTVLAKSVRAAGFLLALQYCQQHTSLNRVNRVSSSSLLVDLPLLEAGQFLTCRTHDGIGGTDVGLSGFAIQRMLVREVMYALPKLHSKLSYPLLSAIFFSTRGLKSFASSGIFSGPGLKFFPHIGAGLEA